MNNLIVGLHNEDSLKNQLKFSVQRIPALLGFFIGLIIFLHGFLLNRSELNDVANTIKSFNYEAKYERLILLIVDGLGFDFVHGNSLFVQNASIIHKEFLSKFGPYSKPYIAKFIADPPTTTLQRLKALMTGSMPTFIDAGSNFGGSEILEDNLIKQWLLAGKKILFVGDETWIDLFPSSFHDTESYPSFNVKDLDTVDKAVRNYFMEKLQNLNPQPNWSILIGHMLGVDHCGHTFGPTHPEMNRKLHELNQFIGEIVPLLKSNDLLLIIGDHGMTRSGDHGGDSMSELESALIAFNLNEFNSSRKFNFSAQLNQIDLVPTLALLTGVSIPYSNLGILHKSLFHDERKFRIGLILNFIQILNYTVHYNVRVSNLPLPTDLRIYLDQIMNTISVEKNFTNLINVVNKLSTNELLDILTKLQSLFRLHWTRFDVERIVIGILLSFSGLFILFCINNLLFKNLFYLNCYLILVCLITLGSHVYFYDFKQLIFGEILLISSILFLSLRFITYSTIKANYYDLDFFSLVLILILSLSYLSNSFIVNEFRVTYYLLQTLFIIKFFISFLSQLIDHQNRFNYLSLSIKDKSLLINLSIIILLRLSIYGEICREESFPNSTCSLSTNPWIGKFLTKLNVNEFQWIGFGRILLAILCLISLICSFRYLIIDNKFLFLSNYSNQIIKMSISFYCLIVICLFGIIWILDAIQIVGYDIELIDSQTAHLLRSYLSRLLLFILFFGMIISVKFISTYLKAYLKLCTTTYTTIQNNNLSNSNFCQSITKCYVNQFIQIYQYWSMISLFLIPLLILLIFLNEIHIIFLVPMILYIKYFILLKTFKSNNENTVVVQNTNQINNENHSWHIIVYACLFDNLLFYLTGHQTSIAGIPWDVAYRIFIGNHQTKIIPAIMISLNLYSGQILIAFCLPLFIILNLNSNQLVVNFLNSDWNYLLRIKQFIHSIDLLLWRFFSLKCILTFSCMFSAGVLRRHLMVWKIFAPRLIFSGLNLIISGVVLILSRLVVVISLSWQNSTVH